jgi:2-dehydro-3-deoxyphosphooctonate aldolase (KDO 8-P synthase)
LSTLRIGSANVSVGDTPILIAGPCVLEDERESIEVARRAAASAAKAGFFYIFKSSYLKDNRSSIDSYMGPGLERGVEMLARIKRETGVPILTDVHCREEVAAVASVADVIQVPAFLVRQTRLVVAAAATGKALNLKKSQMMSPEEMGNAVEKARRGGAGGVMLTERGTFFGYNNLVVDFTSFPRMKGFGAPVIFDATHSLQLPGGLGKKSGGRPEYVATLARAAVAAGCDGLFIETHMAPLRCKCDAEAMLPLELLDGLLGEAAAIFRIPRNESRARKEG